MERILQLIESFSYIKLKGNFMKSKVTMAKHPLHPMLVGFPIAFYTAAMLAFVAYAVNGDSFWFRLAYTSNIAGVVMAFFAAVPGIIDWLLAIPKHNPAKRTAFTHMLLNSIALICFSLNWWLQSGKWNDEQPNATGSIFLTVLGLGFTFASGFLGWSLVQKHHIGIDEKENVPEDFIKKKAG